MKDFGVTCAAGWCADQHGVPARSSGPLGGCPPGWYLLSHVLDGLAPVCGHCEDVQFALQRFRMRMLMRNLGVDVDREAYYPGYVQGKEEPACPCGADAPAHACGTGGYAREAYVPEGYGGWVERPRLDLVHPLGSDSEGAYPAWPRRPR